MRSWLVVESLPGCAPELNPAEALWSNLKGVELANLAGETLQEVTAAAERGIQRIRATPVRPRWRRHSRPGGTILAGSGSSRVLMRSQPE